MLGITQATKIRAWERDKHQCIFCGALNAFPECHFIPRSKGGLGIEENIWTGCRKCHYEFDNWTNREKHEADVEFIEEYLKSKYPNWDKTKLTYRRNEI